MSGLEAIVIGGGIGGLGAAAALSPHVSRVVLLDRDELPTSSASRKAVPQGAHIHILLLAGLLSLDRLLPGSREQLIASGSAVIRAGLDQRIFAYGEWYPERDLELSFLGQSRPHLEGHIRRRVAALPNVTMRPGSRVESIVLEAGSVRGVSVHDDGQRVDLGADLVVDASGVGATFARRLEEQLGLRVPTDEHSTEVFYSTVHFRKPQEFLTRKENILVLPEGRALRRGGSLIDVEDDLWCVSLHGRGAADQPTTMSSWLDFARSLPHGCILERVEQAEPVAPPVTMRKAKAVFRHFDRISTELPRGYFPIGDVMSSFNPIFGQGMTVALGQAVALAEAWQQAAATGAVERSALGDLALDYLRRARVWSEKAWRATVSHDLAFTATTAVEKRQAEMLDALARNQLARAKAEPRVHRQLVNAAQMLE